MKLNVVGLNCLGQCSIESPVHPIRPVQPVQSLQSPIGCSIGYIGSPIQPVQSIGSPVQQEGQNGQNGQDGQESAIESDLVSIDGDFVGVTTCRDNTLAWTGDCLVVWGFLREPNTHLVMKLDWSQFSIKQVALLSMETVWVVLEKGSLHVLKPTRNWEHEDIQTPPCDSITVHATCLLLLSQNKVYSIDTQDFKVSQIHFDHASPVVQVTGGLYHALARHQDGTVSTWALTPQGALKGELGQGPISLDPSRTSPKVLTHLQGLVVIGMASSCQFNIVWTIDGCFYAWGPDLNDAFKELIPHSLGVPLLADFELDSGDLINRVLCSSRDILIVCSDGVVFHFGLTIQFCQVLSMTHCGDFSSSLSHHLAFLS